MTEKKSNIIWTFLSSVKLTIVLLILLAVTSIIGTIIPQKSGALEFAKELSPETLQIFDTLNLFDMYHSFWFMIIIGFLTLNLIICTINRLPTTLKRFKNRPKPDRTKPFENLHQDRILTTNDSLSSTCNSAKKIFSSRFKNIQEKVTDQGTFIYGDKGRYSLFGVYLVHLSIIFILIGAIIGSKFGFEAFAEISEGEYVHNVFLKNSTKHEKKDLGFGVQCNKFHVDFYKDGTPKEYKSELSFLINEEVVQTNQVRVNHPATFRGINFYQSKWGTDNQVLLRIKKEGDDSEGLLVNTEAGKLESLPGGEGSFYVVHFDDNYRGQLGPGVHIAINPDHGEKVIFWALRDIEKHRHMYPEAMLKALSLNGSAFKPYTFYLEGFDTLYYTGLQVSRDPGVIFVWTGFFMMMIGMYITFFNSHNQVWIRITDQNNKTVMSVAGKSNKNSVGMERELDQLIKSLKTNLNTKRDA